MTACSLSVIIACRPNSQGCSLGLETFFWNVSVSSRSWRFNVSVSCRSWRYNVSVSGFVTLGLVNIHAVHQAYRYIRKKIMGLTRKKQVVKWQTSAVSVFKLWHCSLETFSGTSRSRLGLESLEKWNVSVLRVQRPSYVLVSRVWKNNVSVSSCLEGWPSRSHLSLVT